MRILETAGLPSDRLLFSAAAKTCINAAGLSAESARAVRDAATDMQRRLLDETHGRLRLSVAFEPAEHPARFAEQFERASRALRVSKLRPYATTARGRETWKDGALTVRGLWDADAEAERDARVGRDLVNADWLTIRCADGQQCDNASDPSRDRERAGSGTFDTLGYRVRLEASEPTASDGLVSCSNLAKPDTAPRAIDRRRFHARRLARHVPCGPHGDPLEFVDLAAQSRGAPMLGVLKADADSLGAPSQPRCTTSRATALREWPS